MLNERIRQYRKAKGYKVRDFAKLIGISQGSLSDIENGKWTPSGDTISSLVRKTDINPLWLLTGEGDMFREDSMLAESDSLVISKKEDFTLWAIVELLKDMDEESKRDILKHIEKEKWFLEMMKQRQKESSTP